MGLTIQQFKEEYINKLTQNSEKNIDEFTMLDKYYALGDFLQDYIVKSWIQTNEDYIKNEKKQIYYFSIEFLMGKLLINDLINLGIKEVCEEGLNSLGISLNEIEKIEEDQGLGNGGLGRLAACFLDSMASLSIPGHGCGIRYKYGLFEQKIVDGYQVEFPDNWLQNKNIWEMKKEDKCIEVKFKGSVKILNENNKLKFIHENYESIYTIPYDTPIIGYKNNTINTLRLWNSEPISNILYPDDSNEEGKILRLKQEYFFVSAGIQSIIKTFKKLGKPINEFYKYVSIHINDTHPALAIPELIRILIDEEELGWDEAFYITKNTISYTNHTIMAEALEKWNIEMFKELLPRIYMIIEEINERFCKFLWDTKYTGDFDKISKMAIISYGVIKMAHLAIVGSYSVNGVAKLHTEILKKQELKDFYDIYPYKFNNKTNGISHRRWLIKCNPNLTKLINESIGNNWITNPNELVNLLKYKDDDSFKEKINEIKQYNKNKLVELIENKYSVKIDPYSIFDIQIKRFHEYKRQNLNALHIMHLYNELIENPNLDITPRTFIFSGKAAKGYLAAKQTIKLINTLANKINNDKRIKDKLKIVFIENYGVTLSEIIIPAANISEQIATTTKEASGTGNMKFMMNGAITIGTYDGANIEIANEVGKENIMIFGLKAKEVYEIYKNNSYNPIDIYNKDMRVKKVVDELINGFLSDNKSEFSLIYNSLINKDEYFLLKDFDSYVDAQENIDNLYKNKSKWLEMCISNIAHSGVFSSDKTICEYANEIWNVNYK